MRPPLPMGHVALTVPDLDAAVEWYGEMFGLQLVGPPQLTDVREGYFGGLVADVFGESLGAFRLAHMTAGNGIALELFEFVEPEYERRENQFEYWKSGYSHICFIDPEIDALVARIVEHGGRMRTSKVWELFEGEPYKCVYCEDPWGSIIEIYTHSTAQVFARRDTYERV